MDARIGELGAQIDTHTPEWTDELGTRPNHDQPVALLDWQQRAGIVAGYREAFGLGKRGGRDHHDDAIGPPPPPNRPDARAWWQRAATALNRPEPAGLAQLPDERLEAIIDQARLADADAPPPVDNELRAISAALRTTWTAHGIALTSADPRSPAAIEAAARANTLAAAAARLEASHHRRDRWRQATAGMRAQAAGAAAELAARLDARTAAPYQDTNDSTLHAELTGVEARLKAPRRVVEQHRTLRKDWQVQAEKLTEELTNLTATRPALAAAQAAVATERDAAEGIDEWTGTQWSTTMSTPQSPTPPASTSTSTSSARRP